MNFRRTFEQVSALFNSILYIVFEYWKFERGEILYTVQNRIQVLYLPRVTVIFPQIFGQFFQEDIIIPLANSSRKLGLEAAIVLYQLRTVDEKLQKHQRILESLRKEPPKKVSSCEFRYYVRLMTAKRINSGTHVAREFHSPGISLNREKTRIGAK